MTIAGLVAAFVLYAPSTAWTAGASVSDAWHWTAWTMDARRTHDLERLKAAIERFYLRHGDFPVDLPQLVAEEPVDAIRIHDPETGTVYGYRRTRLHPLEYRLCADFRADTPVEKISFSPCKRGEQCFARLFFRFENRFEPGRTGSFWEHGIGETCWILSTPEREYPK